MVPGKVEEVNMPRIEEWLRDITDVLHEIHLEKIKIKVHTCNLTHRITVCNLGIVYKYGWPNWEMSGALILTVNALSWGKSNSYLIDGG